MKGSFISWEEAVAWLKSQPDKSDLVRECYYDDPASAAATRYHSSPEWRAITRLLDHSPKGAALDVGAGRGISTYALARDGWQVTALEPDGSNLVGAGAIRDLATETGLDITVVQKHGEDLPFADDTFSLVFARQVLHHAADLNRFCSEVFRVLKPGGRFIAVREHVITRKEDLPRFLASHPLHELYGGENAYLLDEYRQAIFGSGMILDKVLGPLESDINLCPEVRKDLKCRLEKKIHFSLPEVCFARVVIPLLQLRDNYPGRIYSFLGHKP